MKCNAHIMMHIFHEFEKFRHDDSRIAIQIDIYNTLTIKTTIALHINLYQAFCEWGDRNNFRIYRFQLSFISANIHCTSRAHIARSYLIYFKVTLFVLIRS